MVNIPQIIQGGMGVAISNWQLANAVSRAGQLGVVSGTGVALVMIGRLQRGDAGGHIRRALRHFPFQDEARSFLDTYFVEGGIAPHKPIKRPPMWSATPSHALNVQTVIANFVEVWLAKEGHSNPVGLNLLEKVQMPQLASLYGALLAGIDVVIMGAGVPIQIPGILDSLVQHQPVRYRLDVLEAHAEDEFYVHFDPGQVFPGIAAQLGTLTRPDFLPIISSVILAQALIKRSTGSLQGFVIETPIAGGHNAPPRGQLQLNEKGEPIYGERDVVDLAKMRALGYPFWLAGGYGTPDQLQAALDAGACGIQVGTAFAFCDESGFDATLKAQVIAGVLAGNLSVKTDPLASPTGFPFKVVQLPGSIAQPTVYAERERLCDIGFLRHAVKNGSGLQYRCPAEPVNQYVKKGGGESDTVGRTCLCNHLGAAAGFAQHRSDGYIEPAIITSGDDVVSIARYLQEGCTSYTAQEVIAYLLGERVEA
jgi:NAD(P)H-dependent flavin oxidoreductase YrpB (nitropropane dioxygenase family)